MTATLLALALAAPPDAPLTIGSPAPKLTPLTFVRGDPVKELAAGTVYVVEFSGTNCAPCVKCIPHLNELQKKHPAVVFLSVYSGEGEKAVRTFLAGPGKAIEFRVAADAEGATGKAWSDPACQEGIPHAFVVGANGKIAWVGNPADLTDQLGQIVAGKFDPQEDVLRLRVEQWAVLRARKAEERDYKGRAEYERINQQVIAGKLTPALADTEKALAEFKDSPAVTELLRSMQVYLLANLPGKKEEAFRLATELAVEAKLTGRSVVMTNTAIGLLNAAERAAPAERDRRLIDLALPLLRDGSPVDLRDKPGALSEHLILSQRMTGYAYHLRGDPARATAAIREAMDMVRGLKPPDGVDQAAFKQALDGRLKNLEATLKEYEAGEGKPPAGRR